MKILLDLLHVGQSGRAVPIRSDLIRSAVERKKNGRKRERRKVACWPDVCSLWGEEGEVVRKRTSSTGRSRQGESDIRIRIQEVGFHALLLLLLLVSIALRLRLDGWNGRAMASHDGIYCHRRHCQSISIIVSLADSICIYI